MGGGWWMTGGLTVVLFSLCAAVTASSVRIRWGWLARIGLVAVGVILLGAMGWMLGPGARWWLENVDGVEGLTGKDLAESLDSVRSRAMAVGTGLLATLALCLTASNTNSLRRSTEVAQRCAEITELGQRRTLELAEQGQLADRYTRAIEQLGSDQIEIRSGGIYALERIAHDSAPDHPSIMNVLAGFVRRQSHAADAHVESDDGSGQARERFRYDLQEALTVIGRRTVDHDVHPIDLSEACLAGACLDGGDFANANLRRADLTGASLFRVILTGANLADADLTRASLPHARLSRTTLTETKLCGANLAEADMRHANLYRADLSDANLKKANLAHADLCYADLRDDVNLIGADLRAANLRCVRGLTPEQIRAITRTDPLTQF